MFLGNASVMAFPENQSGFLQRSIKTRKPAFLKDANRYF